MKNIIWQHRSEKWITDVAGTSTWSRHILGSCHINFIKPKTYSALLPPRAYYSTHLWNKFIYCQGISDIFWYYKVCTTHFPAILRGFKAYICLLLHFSRSPEYDLHFGNPTITKTNTWANILHILQNKSTHLHFRLKFSGTLQPHGRISTIYGNAWLLPSAALLSCHGS
jgi:hypothetical protein